MHLAVAGETRVPAPAKYATASTWTPHRALAPKTTQPRGLALQRGGVSFCNSTNSKCARWPSPGSHCLLLLPFRLGRQSDCRRQRRRAAASTTFALFKGTAHQPRMRGCGAKNRSSRSTSRRWQNVVLKHCRRTSSEKSHGMCCCRPKPLRWRGAR